MAALGLGRDIIAASFGLDEATLDDRFADELRLGPARRRREIVGLLFASAKAGNVSAQKRLEEMTRAAGAAKAVEQRARSEPKRGKKEEQRLAAHRVGGRFAPPQPPKLMVVSNA